MTITLDTSKFRLPDINMLNKSLSTALNKTVVTAKKEMSAATREYYNIKKRDLDSKIRVTKATRGNTESVLRITSRPIGLIHFNATASKAFDKGQKRYFKVAAKVLKREKKKKVGGAFIGRAKTSNSYQVFRRTSSKRTPIRKLSVVTPTTMVERHGDEEFFKVINRDFQKQFNIAYKYYMSKQK